MVTAGQGARALGVRGTNDDGIAARSRDPVALAGVRYEVQQRDCGREVEVLEMAFEARGTALVPLEAPGA